MVMRERVFFKSNGVRGAFVGSPSTETLSIEIGKSSTLNYQSDRADERLGVKPNQKKVVPLPSLLSSPS